LFVNADFFATIAWQAFASFHLLLFTGKPAKRMHFLQAAKDTKLHTFKKYFN